MSKPHLLFIIGIIIIFLPFLGIPYAFKSIIIVIAGLAVSFFAILLHVDKRAPVRRVGRTRRKATAEVGDTNTTLSQIPIDQAHDYQIDASDSQ